MPIYSYSCDDCGREVDIFLSLGELHRGAAQCPYCQSKNLTGPQQGQCAPSGAPSGKGGRPSCVIGQKN